ncbi:hypothetical protein [Desulforapulum autotrophicum]|uniref:hypothetical protein n=1 Tax=Desulforapulum autotrophicum TaxID=2296 RepID=UPI0002EA3245|nr:hypothetical protein [Desulforapulum autotrophicum]
MKKRVTLLSTLFVLSFAAVPAFSGHGSAPNSGDGISDGSGMDSPNGPRNK